MVAWGSPEPISLMQSSGCRRTWIVASLGLPRIFPRWRRLGRCRLRCRRWLRWVWHLLPRTLLSGSSLFNPLSGIPPRWRWLRCRGWGLLWRRLLIVRHRSSLLEGFGWCAEGSPRPWIPLRGCWLLHRLRPQGWRESRPRLCGTRGTLFGQWTPPIEGSSARYKGNGVQGVMLPEPPSSGRRPRS